MVSLGPLDAEPDEWRDSIKRDFEEIARDNQVRAVILRGAGKKAFSVGADLKANTGENARRIAQHRTRALILAKDAVRLSAQAPIDAGLAYKMKLATICNMFDDLQEGIQASREKRAPRFQE